MKLNRTYLFIGISTAALIIVLIIQVNWIVETAKVKEELFNEKVNMVLSKTTEALSSDKQTCRNIETDKQSYGNLVLGSNCNTEICMGNNQTHKIDSIFAHYMKFYNLHINYSFTMVKPVPFAVKSGPVPETNIYKRRIDEVVSKNGLELVLILPERREFILAAVDTIFITSVVLIIVVLVMLWRTTASLIKEKEISERTTDFLNNMTHEFKTPLTNIALAGRMIVKESTIGQEDKIRHYSGIILQENEKLRLQVEQVLGMSALERGEMPLQRTEVDMHQVIRDSLKCISVQIENGQGQVKLDLAAENFIIMGDLTHLTNAFCNLIDNAIKYSKEKPELMVQTKNVGYNLQITVSDKGIGIDKEHHEKVFEKFYRVPTGDVHDVKGFGLGLAYVRWIIGLHGGSIELVSEKKKGSTFIIALPNA